MNKLLIFGLVAATLTIAGCSSSGYATAEDYDTERRFQSYDPFMYGQGFYGPGPYGYGNPYRYGFRNANPYRYGYGNPYMNRRRPPVIYRSNPSNQPAPNRVRPINPRTDRYNPREEKRENN